MEERHGELAVVGQVEEDRPERRLQQFLLELLLGDHLRERVAGDVDHVLALDGEAAEEGGDHLVAQLGVLRRLEAFVDHRRAQQLDARDAEAHLDRHAAHVEAEHPPALPRPARRLLVHRRREHLPQHAHHRRVEREERRTPVGAGLLDAERDRLNVRHLREERQRAEPLREQRREVLGAQRGEERGDGSLFELGELRDGAAGGVAHARIRRRELRRERGHEGVGDLRRAARRRRAVAAADELDEQVGGGGRVGVRIAREEEEGGGEAELVGQEPLRGARRDERLERQRRAALARRVSSVAEVAELSDQVLTVGRQGVGGIERFERRGEQGVHPHHNLGELRAAVRAERAQRAVDDRAGPRVRASPPPTARGRGRRECGRGGERRVGSRAPTAAPPPP